MPGINISGTNGASVVRVPVSTGIATSPMARFVASTIVSPLVVVKWR